MKMNSGNMEKMLNTVSGKLGMPVEELKEALNKGDFNSIMAKMDSKGAKKFKDAISNPDVSDVLKNSPEMADFMKNMQKE